MLTLSKFHTLTESKNFMYKHKYLDITRLTNNPNIFHLFKVVESHGGVLRFVGGSVRDAIAGIKGFDIDLATDLSPDELVEACEESAIKTIPIGIKFGTVGVVIDDQTLEVTSLRKDIKTDGRHAEVVFTSDWKEDASRRDLTINAVYADEKGDVFDYYNGIDDLEKGIIRFIGNANQRIREDYLRILRFFRFYSIFSKAPIDEKALEGCKENKEGLKQLSMERIRDEMFKLLLTPKVVETLKIMFDNEILSYVLPDTCHLNDLDFLVNKLQAQDLPNAALRRLFILYTPEETLAENLATRLRMSNKQREDFVNWSRFHPSLNEFLDSKSLRRLIYLYGYDFCRDKLILQCALEHKLLPNIREIITEASHIKLPSFEIKGRDVIAAGIKNNHKISEVLEELEQIWIESDFQLSHSELIEHLPQIIQEKSA